ncbi:MAG: cytochrome c3 family protein, partial [Bacteroidota bacterium]
HAYFNHAQHVSVGKVECQQCHGPIEKMEVVQQYSPLSMGWCINCHRQTEVKFTENDYYKSYVRYQEELETGVREKVTVEDIGGLECQKCHY